MLRILSVVKTETNDEVNTKVSGIYIQDDWDKNH